VTPLACWGLLAGHRFHELGHESQKRPDGAWGYAMPFGFFGATEVTVNLFTVRAVFYVF